MLCPKCGAENPEGSKFCQECGMALAAEAPEKPGKKKTGWIIALAVVAVLAVAAVIALRSDGVKRALARRFLPPEQYYQQVEAENARRIADSLTAGYGSARNNLPNLSDVRADLSLSLALEEPLRELIGTYTAQDYSWLGSLGLDLTLDRSGEYAGVAGALSLNGDKLLDLDTGLDLNTMDVAAAAPMLSDKSVGVNLEETLGEDAVLSLRDLLDRTPDLTGVLPDRQTLEPMLSRYLTMVRDVSRNVERETGVLTVEDVSQTCTVLTVTVSEAQLRDFLRQLCPALRQDRDVQAMVERAGNALHQEGLYEALMDAVDRLEQHAEELRLEQDIVMTLWVDDDDVIRGRTLTAKGLRVEFLNPRSGDNARYRYAVAAEGDSGAIYGAVTETNGRKSGSFTLEWNGVDYLWGDFSDLDASGADRGELSGNLRFYLARELYEGLDLYGLSARYLENMCYSCDFRSAPKQWEMTVQGLMQGRELYFTLEAAENIQSKGESGPLPKTYDIQTWALGRVLDGSLKRYLTYLREETDLPEELLDQLADSLLPGDLWG